MNWKKILGYFLFVAVWCAVLLGIHHACNGASSDNEPMLKRGDKVVVTDTTLGTFRKEDCKEFVRMLRAKDNLGIGALENSGLAEKVDKGAVGKLTDISLGYYRVRLLTGEELWFPSVAVDKED